MEDMQVELEEEEAVVGRRVTRRVTRRACSSALPSCLATAAAARPVLLRELQKTSAARPPACCRTTSGSLAMRRLSK